MGNLCLRACSDNPQDPETIADGFFKYKPDINNVDQDINSQELKEPSVSKPLDHEMGISEVTLEVNKIDYGLESPELKGARVDTPIDHDRRFLIDMLKANKVDDELNEKELSEIQSCVKDILWKACERLNSTELEVVDIVLCGSMAESTRVWQYESIVKKDEYNKGYAKRMLAIEFDFLAVFNRPASKYKIKTCSNGECKGHEIIMNSIDASPKHLQPDVLRHDLRTEIVKFLNKDTTKYRLVYYQVRKYLNDDPRIRYKFLWKSYGLVKRSTRNSRFQRHNTCIVNVDLMPAFLDATPHKENQRYLVAKSKCTHKVCFMKSYCIEEIRMLKETSQTHRDVYILLKSFNRHTKHCVPSYYFETAVLRHIEECDGPDLVVCHRQILKFLASSYLEAELMTSRDQINLLSGSQMSPGEIFIPSVFLSFLEDVKCREFKRMDYAFRDYKRLLDKRIYDFEAKMPPCSAQLSFNPVVRAFEGN